MRRVLLLLVLAGLAIAADDFPLPALGYADTHDISSGWRFAWDEGDRGLDQGWERPEHDRSAWSTIDLPRVWDREPGTVEPPIRDGVGWFARRIRIPEDWSGETVLQFLGVQYQCDCWVDGRYLDLHLGGYTPFAFPLGELVRPGGEHLVVLRVDNRLSAETVPSSHLGWQPYGGITREVYLAERPATRLEGLHWRCSLADDGAALLTVGGRLVGDPQGEVLIELTGGTEAVVHTQPVAAAEGAAAFAVDLRVPTPRLWSPADPHLHRLHVTWSAGSAEIPVGLRELRIDGERLLLNGEPIWLQGFGIHEEWAGHGPCVPHEARRAELELLKTEYGINSLRPGHYPNHPRLYRMCDELGILVFTEIPAWQIPRPWLASDFAWEDWLRPQLAEMVANYGAFSCVVSWGVGNENNGDDADAYHRRALAWIAERDPTRIPMAVVASTQELRLYRHQPLGARNYHFGWYHSKQVYGIRERHAANLVAAAGQPIWVAEQGAHAIRGRYNGAYNDRSRGSEFYQDQTVRFGYQYAATRNDAIIGISPWSWADFYRKDRLEPHGLVDIERRPKLVCSTLRGLMGGGPHRLFGVEETTFGEPGGRFVAELHAFRPEPAAVTGDFRYRWSVRTAAGELAAGEGTFTADGARSQRVAELAWDVPADASGHHGLWFELFDAEGRWLHGGAIHFGVGAAERPGALQVPPGDEAGILWWNGLRLPVPRHPGLIIPLDPGSYRFELERGGERRPLTVEIRSGESTTVEP